MKALAPFRSVVLAGERPGGSSLAREFGELASVMIPVADKPSLERVLQALDASKSVAGGVVCGPAADVIERDGELRMLLRNPLHHWLEPGAGPAASALAAVRKLGHFPALLTTGDHALLTPAIVDTFCQQALKAEPAADIVIGMVPYALVRTAWPESERTILKFAEGGYCGANLFAIMSQQGCRALEFWQQVEDDRKRPWRIAHRLGLTALLRYLFRRVTLEEALAVLSKKAGCRARHVLLDDPRAAVDVDSAADQQLAENILSTD